ncbi:auracyanin [Chloroflexales bacterium ZM16-3]|nr:auracyanin [Chloroflexales bacterium ZM16-3]
MSWRGSGNFRGSGSPKDSRRGGGGGGGSAFSGGSAGGPPLLYLIGGAIGVGVIALIIVISVGMMSGGTQVAAPAAPVATAAPAAPVATAAPAAPVATAAPAAAATAAPAAPAAAATAAPAAPAAAGIPTEPIGPAVTTGSGTALTIGSDGELLAFDKKTLEVAAGQDYTLTFTNNSIAVQHNWVLVEGGADVAQAIDEAAAAAMAKARNGAGAVPPADSPGLLAAMPIVNPGATGTMTFTAPTKPGTYIFLCTFPAHYAGGMTGELIVK